MFLALMQYFTFSSKLSMFYLIIKSALYDIVFFIIMVVVLMLGYSIMGHMLFGLTNSAFMSLSETAMTNVLMIIGEFPISDINTLNQSLLFLFGGSFLLLNMILLNMFIAIIGTHYFEFYIDMGTVEEINIFKIIIKILLDRWYSKEATKKEEVNNQYEDFQEIEQDNPMETDGTFLVKEHKKKKNKCKEYFDLVMEWLIDYANSKPADEEYFEIIESIDGVSHLEMSKVS